MTIGHVLCLSLFSLAMCSIPLSTNNLLWSGHFIKCRKTKMVVHVQRSVKSQYFIAVIKTNTQCECSRKYSLE